MDDSTLKFDVSMIEQSGLESSLKSVLKVRLERKKVYGDYWKESEDWELLAFIKAKCNRLKHFVIDVHNKPEFCDNEIDTLIDLVAYSLFLLENKLRKRDNDNS